VQWVTTEVLGHGRVRRRQLGIVAGVTRLPRAVVRELDLLSDQAVSAVDVAAGSAAERGGVEPGDLIVALNDRIVSSVDDLHRLLTQLPGDALVELTIVRDGSKRDVRLES
jgi:S1-C subfamily serine protease